MNMLQRHPRAVLAVMIILAAAIVVLSVVLWHTAKAPAGPGDLSGTNASGTAAVNQTSASPSAGSSAGTGAAAGSGAHGGTVSVSSGRTITINLTMPAPGTAWTIGRANSISWNPAAGVTGEIELVNATTKATVGVILSQTDMNQTSYSWNTRSVYLSRYSPQMKDILPGAYFIRIHFDGNNLGDLTSGTVYITE